jgi:hypothetical protein
MANNHVPNLQIMAILDPSNVRFHDVVFRIPLQPGAPVAATSESSEAQVLWRMMRKIVVMLRTRLRLLQVILLWLARFDPNARANDRAKLVLPGELVGLLRACIIAGKTGLGVLRN